MVLDDLGDSLKGTLKKIANAVHIDKKLVKEVVRDIQRALLQADVNVKLVLNLSKKIGKRALEEKPPAGMSNREHVIRIVYEELVNILGDARELPVKKQIIMMVGLYGQGKCVHGKSIIPLNNGDMQTAKSIYDNYSYKFKEKSIGDGTIIDITNEDFSLPSFNPNTLKIENKKVTHLWKLKGKELYKISIDAGNNNSVSVTPEHPFFIMRNGIFMQARADQLQKEDYIAVPRSYNTQPKKVDLLPKLKKLDIDVYLEKEKAKTLILNRFGTIKNAILELKTKRNYSKFTLTIKEGKVPISLLQNEALNKKNFKIKSFKSKTPINFPKYLTKNLAEFLGYVIGDGHITKKTVEIFNADEEIIRRINYLSLKIFGIKTSIVKDKRSKAKRILISSKTLAELFHSVFKIPYDKKGRNLQISNLILKSSNNVLSSFLRAYFDCDGYVTKKYRNIAITSESEILIRQINSILRRFSIFSTISTKNVKGIDYHKLCIQARYAESFDRQIGSLIKHKKERLTRFLDMGKIQGCGKHDMIPAGETLKDLRESLGHSIGQIQDRSVNSYGIYEKNGLISREALIKLSRFYYKYPRGNGINFLQMIKEEKNPYNKYKNGLVNALGSYFTQNEFIEKQENVIQITTIGETYLHKSTKYYEEFSENTLDFLHKLAFSDVCWIKVRDIETIESPKYVYDFTVEDNHSFIADGIIVHNTTTCGKLATYFKKKGLRPAVIAGDIHRPAAYDQLKQIAEQVKIPFYGEKEGKDAVKVVKQGLRELKKSNDVIIVDTSGRHKLEDDLIDEMKEIFKAAKPDEKLLVMDAAVGQQAGPQAKAFNEAVDITGIVLTKLDGTAKGGGALSAASEVDAPIVFIGTGEHATDFEKFDPSGFISRLLGMGDIKSLIEKAEESLKGKDAEKTAKRIMSGKFTLHDMYDQMDMLKNMGSLSKISEMLPGGFPGKGKIKDKHMQDTEHKMSKFKVIMDSMTDEEMENPNIVRSSRIKRIARGAGVENKNVKELLKYYNMMKRTMKGFSGNRKMRKNLMKQLKFNQ